ncbi:MAG: hypothetical protein GXP27_21615 [Planctomycetes bacterium]|nr:hypothetical protein [Planctomycetota bacterium]
MRNVLGAILLIGSVFVVPHRGVAAEPPAAEKSEWRAGTATVVITPEKSMWMAGYAARKKPSEGKVHDLFAKALALQDRDGNRLVIVTVDLIGIPKELRAAVEKAAQEQHGLPPEALLMNASHTHCGPEIRMDVPDRYGTVPEGREANIEYSRKLTGTLIELVGQALKRLEPAELVYSHARCGFAMNRRLPTDRGFINSPNPDGPVDHDVPVLRVQAPDGKLRAILFGYACHSTTLGFYQFCGDYPGFAHQYLEEAHPGVTALFLQGCGGDQNPYPRRTLELAQQHGRALANAVEAALQTKRTRTIHGPLRAALDDVTLQFAPPPSREELQRQAQSKNKYERAHAERLLKQLKGEGSIRTEYDFPLQVIRFGDDLTLVALCGEAVVDYSLRLKWELRGGYPSTVDGPPVVWVAGYSNYVFGYLPSRRVLEEGGYEGGGAMRYTAFPGPFASSVEDRVMAKLYELFDRVGLQPPRPCCR